MIRLRGAPIRVGVAMVLIASLFSSVAQSQQLAAKANDPDAGSSYTLRKSTLWFNRYVQDRGVYGAAYADFNKDGLIDAAIAPVDFSGAREPVRFMISLSSPMSTGVSFDIATSNGSATSGSDYVARTQLARVLDAGRTRQAFEVQVNGDAVAEPDETFTVTVSNVSGATLADGVATGTIVSDDQATVASPASAAASSNTLRSVLALVGSTGTEADACRNLAQYIAQTETRIAARELGQRRGIALIVKAENLRQQLQCR